LITDGEAVVFQGSIQLFRKLKKELRAFPIGWMTDENYLCSAYYSRLKPFLFNDRHEIITVEELKDRKSDFYAKYGKEDCIFVRPDGGDKQFKGQLLDLQDFDRFWQNSVSCESKPDDLVVASTPKNMRGEWRYICTQFKEILGVSLYMYNNLRTYVPSAPARATELVKQILEVGWYPDPVFTVDIVEDMDGDYWLMEMNSFTTAGTYAAPKSPIVRRVSEIAENQYIAAKRLANNDE
jgi:hypothetical protein